MMKKQIIAAFDFDGTITNKDTFTSFIRFTKGNILFLSGFILFSPLLVAYKLKLYPNWKIKQKIFSFFFKGIKLTECNKLCEDFYGHSSIIRAQAENAIRKHIQHGEILVIISASIENWVQPFAEKFKINNILCTQLEVDTKGYLTGLFASSNCYGREKVNRLLKLFPDRGNYYLIAYGDSSGDKELLEFADEGYFKQFE